MKYFSKILIVILINTNAYAKVTPQKDSIDVLISIETVDSVKLNHIFYAISNLGLKDEKEIMSYFKVGEKICLQSNENVQLFRLYLNTAAILYFSGNVDSAYEMYSKVKNLALTDGNVDIVARANLGLNEFYFDKGEKEKAKTLLFENVKNLKGKIDKRTLSSTYNRLSVIYRDASQFDKAIQFISLAIDLQSKDEISRTSFGNYSSLGRIYRFMGNNDSAKIAYKKAEDISIEMNDELALSTILNNLGNLEHISGNYDSAVEYYLRSLKIKEKFNNQRGTAVAYHNIGAIKFDMKAYQEAILDFEKSNIIGENVNYKPIVVYNEQKIGNCHRALGNVSEALKNHQKALNLSKEIGFKNGTIEALQNIGEDYILLKNFALADLNLIEGLKMAKEAGSKPFESALLVLLSKSYLNNNDRNNTDQKILDNTALNNKDIESYLLRAKELADEMNNVDSKKLVLEGLNLYYTKTNNPKKNVEILKQQLSLKDSLFSKERTQAVADWETKYETAEKEKEIIQLEVEKEASKARTKFWSIISFLLLTIISIGSYLFLKLRQARSKLELQNSELKELNLTKDKFFGIIAHDIRSPIVALESVDDQMNYYLKKNNIEKLTSLGGLVGKTARHLNSLLDNLLNWALVQTKNIPYNPLEIDLNNLIEDTLSLFQANLELKQIDVVKNIDINLSVQADEAALSTILRNLISNAIKFSNKKGKLFITVLKEKGKISFSIKDTGVGISKSKMDQIFTLENRSQKGTLGEKGTGLGLVLCKELIELHEGQISVESVEGQGTEFKFGI